MNDPADWASFAAAATNLREFRFRSQFPLAARVKAIITGMPRIHIVDHTCVTAPDRDWGDLHQVCFMDRTADGHSVTVTIQSDVPQQSEKTRRRHGVFSQ